MSKPNPFVERSPIFKDPTLVKTKSETGLLAEALEARAVTVYARDKELISKDEPS